MPASLAGEMLPDLLGDKGHDRVQQMDDPPDDPGRRRLRLGARRRILALQDRLCELEIPVAEGAPHELVKPVRRLVEAIGVESGGNVGGAVGRRRRRSSG